MRLSDEVALLGDFDVDGRRQEPTGRVLPTGEDLDADDLLAGESLDRLVTERERVIGERGA